MRVSLNWLKDYVDVALSAQELGHRLTMIGLEVEGLERVGQSLDDIVVCRILSVGRHPGADRLFLCLVDAGGKPLSVVSGAPNLKEGSMAPLALPGARLPDGTEVRKEDINGVTSEGVLLAEDELGLTEDHQGILLLPPGLKPGAPFARVFPVDDWVLEIGITPNRPDCACVMGVAREVAAATGARLRRPEIRRNEKGPPVQGLACVDIEDPLGCPRYSAGIIQGVSPGPSPFWLRYRLHLCGIRSINNIVDITNYVMLETGQPLHAFDHHRLTGHRIVVRRASAGDRFTTLDGESRSLSQETLMICDGEQQVAVAGVMGGLNSEISAGTRDVLVESAFFDPVTIRRGSKHLGLSTEASYRFERGIDIGGTVIALHRALALMQELAGGRIAGGVIDNHPRPRAAPRIRVRTDRINRFLGTDISVDEMGRSLKALEMSVSAVSDDVLEVIPPSFRIDIAREVDLAEEVARLHGYDRIPVTYPSVRPSEERDAAELELRDRARALMTGFGFTEVITYSFVSPDSLRILGSGEEGSPGSFVRIVNPITVDNAVMRTSLFPGLMGAVQTNVMHEERNLRLFEWGKIFLHREDEALPLEKVFLAGLVSGLSREKEWYRALRAVDFFDIKGAASALLKGLGAPEPVFRRDRKPAGYDGEGAALILCGGDAVGRLGRVSAEVHAAYGLEPRSVYMFEMDMGALGLHLPASRRFHAFPRFPAVYRDVSVIVERGVESGRVMRLIREAGGDLVESVRLFDVYEGGPMDRSEKALAYRVCYRSGERTLDGADINRLHESVIERITMETGGRLREG